MIGESFWQLCELMRTFRFILDIVLFGVGFTRRRIGQGSGQQPENINFQVNVTVVYLLLLGFINDDPVAWVF